MIKFLIKLFIKDSKNTEDKHIREKYSILSGSLGIICNIILFIVKTVIGIMMNSIAIISDGVNNLSDMGSSIISIVGAKLSNKQADREHPFGHGRIEYISSLIVSMIIMVVGIELFRTSILKIITPEPINFNLSLTIILILSLLIKLWMYYYNSYMSRRINSTILLATAQDSINDVISTTAVILSTIIGHLFHLQIDGYVGLIVSVLVFISGFKIAKNVISTLLGNPPTTEVIQEIENTIMSEEGIIGVHDLIVHDYGPGRTMASIHAEVPDDINIVAIHEVIDYLEKKIQDNMGILMVIHMDPVSNNNTKVNNLKTMIREICLKIDERFSIHDFRITDGEKWINIIFDLVVPCEFTLQQRQDTINKINSAVKEKDEKYHCVIQIDNDYLI